MEGKGQLKMTPAQQETVGAGEEGLPSVVESRGSRGLQGTPTSLPYRERCLMLARCCTRLSVEMPRGHVPGEEAELTGRTVDGACPKRLPHLML